MYLENLPKGFIENCKRLLFGEATSKGVCEEVSGRIPEQSPGKFLKEFLKKIL